MCGVRWSDYLIGEPLPAGRRLGEGEGVAEGSRGSMRKALLSWNPT